MTQDKLSIVDIFRMGELFEVISRKLFIESNPHPADLQDLIEIFKKSEHLKEVVEDLEKLAFELEKEKGFITEIAATKYIGTIKTIRGRIYQILKDRVALQELP
ncbi:MAG: hypothetical protein KAV25_08620 [Methanophagales archaeon]|nr:hypothetical protein [Methanophagales archaeon]